MLRALGLGDLLTGVPALRALRRAYPAGAHEVVLACPGSLAPLVSLASSGSGRQLVDRLLPARGLEPLGWDGPPPHVAVNLHGKGPQSHELLQALAPGRLVAFGCFEAGHDGPRWRAGEHEVRRWCRLVEESLGVPAPHADLLLSRPRSVLEQAVTGRRPGAVVVHPGAAYPSRRWPPDRFAEVARRLAAAGHDVVVTGGAQEVALAGRVAEAAGLSEDAVLAGRTDLTELSAVVASARLVVCGDTGVAHLATAFGTPSVVLFGPVSPSLWGPVTDGPHTVIWHGDGSGDPWGAEVDSALLKVEVDEVMKAAEALLAPA